MFLIVFKNGDDKRCCCRRLVHEFLNSPTMQCKMHVMAKKTAPRQYNTSTMQPDEIKALRALVQEFMQKVESVDNEIETLKEDRKEIIESYKEKLDLATLTAALKVIKIQNAIAHRDTFDLFLEVLKEE